ncbi:MAG: hypothetical protein J2P48_07585, partial [Alphaproteobacteria bacterium]|nr:hypothetical protein [Alphaproteobacteria bacterium]
KCCQIRIMTNILKMRAIAGALKRGSPASIFHPDLDRAMITAIRRPWLEHLVIFFTSRFSRSHRGLARSSSIR